MKHYAKTGRDTARDAETTARTRRAHQDGEDVVVVETWNLDTGGDGHDEKLVGTEEEVWADVAHHHDCQEDELEARGWTLTRA